MGSLDFVDSEGGDEEKEGKKGKGKKEDGVDKKKKKVYENKNTVGTDCMLNGPESPYSKLAVPCPASARDSRYSETIP